MGEAIGNLGKGIEKAGGEIFQRAMALQELRNDAEAKEADARFTIELGKLHADFNTLQGKAAVEGYDKYREDIRQLREGIGSELSSDRAKKLYDSTSRGQAARSIFNGAGYAATQNKNYLLTASEARVKANADSFYQDPDKNPKEFEREVRIEALQRAAIKGWAPDDPQTKEMIAADTSKAWLNKITGLANSRPFEAKELLEANKGKLHGDDIRKAETVVENKAHNAGSRIISEQVLRPIYDNPEDAKEKTREQLVKEGEDIAEKKFPNDSVMKGYVRERIESSYNRFKSGRREAISTDMATLEEAISGYKTGKKLFTEDEITASSPAAAEAWDRLPEAKRRALRRQLVSNSRGDFLETPENKDRFTKWAGMAALKPHQFLEETEDGYGEMPEKWKDVLGKARIAILRREEVSPKVGKAVAEMRQQFGEAVPKSTDGDRYWLLVGTVSNMMAEYEAEYKKPMPAPEKQKMAAFLMQNQPKSWYQRQYHEFDMVQTAIDQAKKGKAYREAEKTPSDQELRQEAVRQLYNRSYQKFKDKNKSTDKVPKIVPAAAAESPDDAERFSR